MSEIELNIFDWLHIKNRYDFTTSILYFNKIKNKYSNLNLISYKDLNEFSNPSIINFENKIKKFKPIFKLQEDFIAKYKDKEPFQDNLLGWFTYNRTYARIIKEDNEKYRLENFYETIRRCVEGCFSIYLSYCYDKGIEVNLEKITNIAKDMYECFFTFKALPSGRSLWIMGTNFMYEYGSMGLNNCGFISTQDINMNFDLPFIWCMDALMLGVGVGFDTLGRNKIIIKNPQYIDFDYYVHDSRTGWIQLLSTILQGYFKGSYIPKNIDYSKIRKKGEPIKGFGGISSGPEPLKELINKISEILNNNIGKTITSTIIVDIMNLIAKCVVSGNVRRSAEIALGNIDDDDFILLKTDYEQLKEYRWASNNSVIIYDNNVDYNKIVECIKINGEPGIFWLENARKYGRLIDRDNLYLDRFVMGTNPCGEQSLCNAELCNLIETFPSNHNDLENYKKTLYISYIYAKIVTLLPVHWEITNNIMQINRRIGISQSGIIDAFAKFGRDKLLSYCDKYYKYIREIDKNFSIKHNIPTSIKITTVKPSGTTSILANVNSGIHYPYSKYYIRRVRIAKTSPLLSIIKELNLEIEEDFYDKNSYCIKFPIKNKNFIKSRFDISMEEQLQNVIDYQTYWSDNQVSVTITFKKDEEKDILNIIQKAHKSNLKSLSFLPIEEHSYNQPPYESITEEEYNKMISNIKKINFFKI